MAPPTLCLTPSTFDANRLKITDPVITKYNLNGAPMENNSSQILYCDASGQYREFYLTGPKQFIFGLNLNHPLGTKDDQKTPANANGLQVCYQVTSLQTVNAPTDEERAFDNAITAIHAAVTRKVIEVVEQQSMRGLCTQAQGIVALLKMKNSLHTAVKPVAEYPMLKDKSGYDTTKPKRLYSKLVGKVVEDKVTKQKALSIQTRIKGVDGTPINPFDLLNIRGNLEPVFKPGEVHYGAHGQTSYAASIKIPLVQARFELQGSTSSVPEEDLLADLDVIMGGGEGDFTSAGGGSGGGSSVFMDMTSGNGVGASASETTNAAIPSAFPSSPQVGEVVQLPGKGKGKGKGRTA